MLSDQPMRAMFQKFASSFDQRCQGFGSSSRQDSFARPGALDTLVSLIWARQQLSVSLGRMRGYPQPWTLGCWPGGPELLLAPESLYYMQAEMRLSVMVAQLEEEQTPEAAVSVFMSLCASGSAG